ncbi:MAG: asparaginase [Gemmatimonadales bacterium]
MQEFSVVSSRGGRKESEHTVSVIVVDAGGAVVAHAGDAELATFWRSASKPFQLYPLVADGGVERFDLDDAMLALACGSHNGESVHREIAARWLARIGVSEADLVCGGHPSLWPALAEAMIHDDVTATPIWSNCSGKHAAMLASARLHDWGISGYESPDHPVQRLIAASIARWTAIPESSLAWGLDGCNAPAVALPLAGMARAYCALGESPDAAINRIRTAMLGQPYLVAGAERLDTVLMQAWSERVIAKIGADGVYSAALPGLGLGLALKVHDGDMRAAAVALVAVLEALTGRFASAQSWPTDTLGTWRQPVIRNTRSIETGRIETRGGLAWA